MRELTRQERRAIRALERLGSNSPDDRDQVSVTAEFIVLRLLHPAVQAAYKRLEEQLAKEPDWGEPGSPERRRYLAWELRQQLADELVTPLAGVERG